MPDVLLYAAALVRDNHHVGRDIALTERAATEYRDIVAGPLAVVGDPRVPTPALRDLVADIVPGSRYVLCVLAPTHDFTIDQTDLADSLKTLTGGAFVPRRRRST